jgi:hypothetical protein
MLSLAHSCGKNRATAGLQRLWISRRFVVARRDVRLRIVDEAKLIDLAWEMHSGDSEPVVRHYVASRSRCGSTAMACLGAPLVTPRTGPGRERQLPPLPQQRDGGAGAETAAVDNGRQDDLTTRTPAGLPPAPARSGRAVP